VNGKWTRPIVTRAAARFGRSLGGASLLILTVALCADAGRLGRSIEPGAAAQKPSVPLVKSSLVDGVFTDEQAERGREAYAEACTYCHRDDLSGNEDGAPPLRGSGFLGRWTDRPLSELSFVIRETMPQDDPRSLTANQCADIVAFLLKRNGAPAGKVELPPDIAVPEGNGLAPPPRR